MWQAKVDAAVADTAAAVDSAATTQTGCKHKMIPGRGDLIIASKSICVITSS